MRRFKVRTLMILVAAAALLMASVGPGRQVYRRWAYHRAEAARFARLEAIEYLNNAREMKAADRELVWASLRNTPDFMAKNPAGREKHLVAVVNFHKQQADQALASAKRWADNRRDSQHAMWSCWDPFAPSVP